MVREESLVLQVILEIPGKMEHTVLMDLLDQLVHKDLLENLEILDRWDHQGVQGPQVYLGVQG